MSLVANHNNIVPQTCGVGVLGIFREQEDPPEGRRLLYITPMGGCGWVICSFTEDGPNSEECAKAYRMLKKRWKIVYEAPVRVNSRTGHRFYFCIYDTKVK